MRLLHDTNVLGQICHPRRHQDVRTWFARAVFVHEMLVPEIADYELRRELLRIGSQRGVAPRRADPRAALPASDDGDPARCGLALGAPATHRATDSGRRGARRRCDHRGAGEGGGGDGRHRERVPPRAARAGARLDGGAYGERLSRASLSTRPRRCRCLPSPLTSRSTVLSLG